MTFYGLEKTQEDVAKQLGLMVDNSDFPSSVLFAGPRYSGRMFAALSAGRAIGVPEDGTVIISDRDHSYRISAALKLYSTKRNKASGLFLKESVSVFLRQFHGALLDSQSSAGKKRFSDASETVELLCGLEDVREGGEAQYAEKIAKSLKNLIDLDALPSQMKINSVSVGQVRALRQWCSTSSLEGKPKLIIIEGLENSLPAAVNALLKTLEEPPEDTHFILISSNPGRIAQTILSRVRRFDFRSLSEDGKKYIFSRLFVNPTEYPDLESFFVRYSGVDDELLEKSAQSLVYNKKCNMPSLICELEKTQTWDRFFSYLVKYIQKKFWDGEISQQRCMQILSEMDSSVTKGKSYMQMRRLTFDSVLFILMEHL